MSHARRKPSRTMRPIPARHSPWLYLLMLSLLGQMLLPVQAHTRWQRDGQGRLVELCTLQGVRTVHLDPDTGQPLPAGPDHGVSPAMAFSALLSHAAVATIVPLPRVQGHLVSSATPPHRRTPLPPELPEVAIRAPPAILA
jgi:hypothetical protein